MRSLIESALRTALARRAVITAIRRWPGNKMEWFDRYRRRIERGEPIRTARTYFGSRLQCDIRDFIGLRIFYFGVWEPSVSKCIERCLRPGDTFVDLGANIGYDSLLGSQRVGPTGRVVAIEASPHIFRRLQSNLLLNSADNVRSVNVAASDNPGKLQLFGGDAANLGRTSPVGRPGLTPDVVVDALPLDGILTEAERAGVRLIKIDIEGGEAAVLSRLVDTLGLYPSNLRILVEISPDDGGPVLAAAFQALLEAGFRAYAVENSYSLDSYLRPTRPGAPTEIRDLPAAQTDVLFSRTPI